MALKALHIVVRKGQAEEVINSTDDPFQWFPELERMFTHNFKMKNLEFDLDLDEMEGMDKDIVRITFRIEKLA